MKVMSLFIVLFFQLHANENSKIFLSSQASQFLCHIGQHSFRIVSKNNATLLQMNGHDFFKVKDQNLYFLTSSCQVIKP